MNKLINNINNLDLVNKTNEIITYPTNGDFLPSGTVINVKLDGTGDFTTLAEALNYLNNKWSYGGVIILLDEGIHIVTSSIVVGAYITNSGRYFEFITIKGKGKDKTIVRNTGDSYCLRAAGNMPIHIYDLTFDNGTNTSKDCISVYEQGNLILDNTDFKNLRLACYAHSGGNILINSTVTYTNVATAFRAYAGTINMNFNVNVSFSSVTTAFQVGYGGIIRGYHPNITYTNVTNKTSQAVGTATNNGWIAGITV